MQSRAYDFHAYLAESPEQRREAFSRLHELCRIDLAGFDEGMAYGLPSYAWHSVTEIAFASWIVGSCDLPAYAPYCDRVHVVRGLGSLERLSLSLATAT